MLRVVVRELLSSEGLADRVRLIGSIRFVYLPELPSDLVADARLGHQFMVSFEIDLNSVNPFARVKNILLEILISDPGNFLGEQSARC